MPEHYMENHRKMYISVSQGLLDTKHVKALSGTSIWLYLWFLDHMTNLSGSVLGGKPITYNDVKKTFDIRIRTYRRWIEILENGGYIKTVRTPRGLVVTVNKAKKLFSQKIREEIPIYDPMEDRRKMSDDRKGEKHYNWQGGITPENAKRRKTLEYRSWRLSVFERDDYTCKFCGRRGGRLEADHIKPVAHHPELIADIDNGQTLCKDCHKKKTKADREVYKMAHHTKNRSAKNGTSEVPKMAHRRSKVAHLYRQDSIQDSNTTTPLPPKGGKRRRKKREPTEEEKRMALRYIEIWNKVNGTKYQSIEAITTNLIHWLTVYKPEDIVTAMQIVPHHDFWAGKMEPETLLRQWNPNREKVDYIGKMLNYLAQRKTSKPTNNLSIKNLK